MEKDLYIDGKLTIEDLYNYLVEAESYTVHYNKGERGKTAPTGIYYKSYPNWEGWRYLSQLAKDHDIKFDPAASNKEGTKELTEILVNNDKYRNGFDKLVYKFIDEEFIQPLHLEYFPGKKSALSYFSIAINGGKGRAAKILQKVLNKHGFNLKVDGQAGNKTYSALIESGLDDEYLNQQLLYEMYNFYNRLIARNPAKYERFYNGWVNRLKRLGFKLNT